MRRRQPGQDCIWETPLVAAGQFETAVFLGVNSNCIWRELQLRRELGHSQHRFATPSDRIVLPVTFIVRVSSAMGEH